MEFRVWAIPFGSIVCGLVIISGDDQPRIFQLENGGSDLRSGEIWEQFIEGRDAVICPVTAIVEMLAIGSVLICPPDDVLIDHCGINTDFFCDFRVEAVHLDLQGIAESDALGY